MCWRRTEVHVDGARPLGVGHVLVHSVQDLLLHLCDGVTVQHLYWNLGTVFVVRIDAVQDLGKKKGMRKKNDSEA